MSMETTKMDNQKKKRRINIYFVIVLCLMITNLLLLCDEFREASEVKILCIFLTSIIGAIILFRIQISHYLDSNTKELADGLDYVLPYVDSWEVMDWDKVEKAKAALKKWEGGK